MSDADARWPSHEELGTFDEEQRWIALIRGGDEAAFKALYDRDAMFAFAHSSLESRAEAEDVGTTSSSRSCGSAPVTRARGMTPRALVGFS